MRSPYSVFGIIEILNKILLVIDKNKPLPNMWKLPGGKANTGEYPELTLTREIMEEIGINIERPLETDVIFKKKVSEDGHIFMVYTTRYYVGEVSIGEEIEKAKLFSLEQIKPMILQNEILPRHAMALTQYFLLGK